MDSHTPSSPALGSPRDWHRPIPVGRFAALTEPLVGAAFGSLSSIGRMVAPDGTDVDPTAPVLGWPENAPPAPTDVLAGFDFDNLYLRTICREPCVQRMRLTHHEMCRNDHILVCIDPLHNHQRYLNLLVLPDGRSQQTWNTVNFGFMASDLAVRGEPGPLAVDIRATMAEDAWTIDIVVPWRSLGLQAVHPGQCLGLNVTRYRTVGAGQTAQWSPTFGVSHDARYFGDLYVGQPPAILQEVRLGGPNWGPNRGYARFAASGPVWAWVEARESIEPAQPWPVRLEAGPYGFAGYSFDYTIDPRDILGGRLVLKWSNRDPAEASASPPAVSEASFAFGWKNSVLLTHVAGRAGQPARPQDGGSPDFYARMCDYLLSRLPRLRREGGRYLASADGVRIDLLAPDPLTALAQSVVDRIEGFDDQLAGCALVLCQPDVLVSSATMNRMIHAATPAGVLWIGGGFCDIYSMVLAALMERLAALNGKRVATGLFWLPFPPGSSLPWPNHWWGCAWLDAGLTILDAELGRFFYRRDGKHLATVNDLFADPALADIAGIGLGDYFRLCKPADGLIRDLPRWREIRPEP